MRHLLAAMSMLMTVALIACGPKPKTPSPAVEPPTAMTGVAPSHLTVTASTSGAELRWQTNQPANRVLSGYNIYLAREDGAFEKITSSPYPGDLDPGYEFETYRATGLDNGVRYRFRVSTVYPNAAELFCEDTVETIPRPQGWIRLNSSFSKEDAGFSFARLQAVSTDDLTNDIYLTVIDAKAHLASPQRIDVVLRRTQFYPVSAQSADNFDESPPPIGDGKDVIPIRTGSRLYLKTQDGCYALVQIDRIDVKGKSVELSFVYQTRPNTFTF